MYKPQLATLDSMTSSVTGSNDPGQYQKYDADDDDDDEDKAPPVITVGLSIRRGRLALFTVAMLAIIVGLTIYLNLGLELSRFNSSTKSSTQQTKLLDDYNSYSGSITSAFGKPIAFFVAISTQVIVLRFMAEAMTRSGSSFKAGVVALAIGALIGYLITNGFNALNVQLRPLDVTAKIAASDLSVSTDSETTANITNVTNVVPESIARNPMTNTLLRNLVRTQVPIRDTHCASIVLALNDGTEFVTETTLQLNIPQRSWQDRVLSTAVDTSKVRLVLNPTNASVNDGIRASDLPMNASTAADLLIYSTFMGRWFFPWPGGRPFVNGTAMNDRYTANKSLQVRDTFVDSIARANGLLPMDSRDETGMREFFLKQSTPFAELVFSETQNTSKTDISMEFSHVDISPTITFDAVTFEFQLDPLLLASYRSLDNTTTFTQFDQYRQCGARSGKCMVQKPAYSIAPKAVYDPPAQVAAYAMCADENGVETLATNATIGQYSSLTDTICGVKSNNSILIVSVAKRLVADSLAQNMTVNETGVYPEYVCSFIAKNPSAVATNLRKIYTYMVGRLAWKAVDLPELFNAQCEAKGSSSSCQGLHLPLEPASSSTNLSATAPKEWLVVGLDALPLGLVRTVNSMENLPPVKNTLVAVNEPRLATRGEDVYPSGDILLPHNIRNFTWDPQSQPEPTYCLGVTERNMQNILDNHYYMEYSLQTAYTAATFFLFQNAAVKTAISLSTGEETLNFDGNTQLIAVWVSTPDINAWLTLGGCVLLVLGLGATMVKVLWFTPTDNDPLAKITQPEAIARVMLDEKQFPPLLLHRRVVDHKSESSHNVIDHFAIGSLSLQPQEGHTEATTAAKNPAATMV